MCAINQFERPSCEARTWGACRAVVSRHKPQIKSSCCNCLLMACDGGTSLEYEPWTINHRHTRQCIAASAEDCTCMIARAYACGECDRMRRASNIHTHTNKQRLLREAAQHSLRRHALVVEAVWAASVALTKSVG